MSYDIYHSITQIPTFITKSGLNLINNYPDRFALDHRWTSDDLIESYYLDPNFGESLNSFHEMDYDLHSMDTYDSLEEEKQCEMNTLNSHPPDSHTFIIKDDSICNQEWLKKSVSSALSVDFPKYSSLSRLHSRHRYCSCYFSNSNSSLDSNDSSFYSSSSSSSLDPSLDPDTQKTYSIIKKIKKLILLGRNNCHISVEDENKGNIIGNENNKSNNDKDNNNNTMYVSNSNLNPSVMVDNPKEKKESNMDLTALPHSSNKNNSNTEQKLYSKSDTLEPIPTNLPVKKKDNIYDINTLNNSKYSFLHQKDQFLKTFICLPGSGFQITNDNHGYNLVEKAFDNDNDTEFLNITSEEINYLKDHPPHFHSCYYMSLLSKDQNHFSSNLICHNDQSDSKIISQKKEINQKDENKKEKEKEKESNNIIKHIKNCSCNVCLEKNLLQGHDSNKIPLYKKKQSENMKCLKN
ncbi:hypothetical protein U3516DRAFT_847653 [Neocallimastix sp. 'constans']